MIKYFKVTKNSIYIEWYINKPKLEYCEVESNFLLYSIVIEYDETYKLKNVKVHMNTLCYMSEIYKMLEDFRFVTQFKYSRIILLLKAHGFEEITD
jgi:hypothetical protein